MNLLAEENDLILVSQHKVKSDTKESLYNDDVQADIVWRLTNLKN